MYAAGNNELEVVEIGVYVERKTVRSYAAGDMNANRGHLGLGVVRRLAWAPGQQLHAAGIRRHGRGFVCVHTPVNIGGVRHNAEVGAGANQHFLQAANIIHRAQGLSHAWIRRPLAGFFVRTTRPVSIGIAKVAQIENGIAHQLPRAVIGHISATIALINLDPFALQMSRRGEDVAAIGVSAQRDHGRMFQQQENIRDLAGVAQVYESTLELKSGSVV